MKHRAFTLVEILIVVMVVGTVTVGLALSLNKGKAQAEFKNAEYELTNIIQEARELSLANILIEDSGSEYETDYYLLEVAEDGVTLTAHGTDNSGSSITSEIESVELDEAYGLEIDTSMSVYYVPPYGETCFALSDNACDYSSGDTEQSFTLSREGSDQDTTFTLSIYSGYPELD